MYNSVASNWKKDNEAIEMKKTSLISISSYLISLTLLTLLGCETRKADLLTSNNAEEISDTSQQNNFTCVTAIQYELVPEGWEGPDALLVCISTSDKELIKALERESPSMYVWKDTMTTSEDSTVFSFRRVMKRKISKGRYELFKPTTDIRLDRRDGPIVSDLELSRNPQVKIIFEQGKQWVVRSCHLTLIKK